MTTILLYNSLSNNKILEEIKIEPTTILDIPKVIELMKAHQQVAYCEWENFSLLERTILENPCTNLIAKKGNEIIGALIGGSFGVRRTISHIALAETYRKKGVGRALANQAFEGFKSIGIQRIFLFIMDDNLVAYTFWKEMGFQQVEGETTLELDL